MSKNAIRNLVTALFCGAEGIHFLVPCIPLGVSTTLGLFVRALMDQYAPAVPANDPVVVAPLVPNTPNATPATTTTPAMKIPAILLAFLLSSSAFAWDFPSNEVRLAPKLGAVLGDSVASEQDIFAAVPYFDGLFKFSTPIMAGSGGLGVAESIGIFRVSPNTDGTVNVNPQLFVGFGINAYPGEFLGNNLQGAIPIDFGMEIGVPTIQGVGSFTIGYDFSDQKVTVSGTAPLDVLSGGLIHTFFNL